MMGGHLFSFWASFQHLLFAVIYTRRAEMSFKRSHRRHKSLLTLWQKTLPRSCYWQKYGVKRPNVVGDGARVFLACNSNNFHEYHYWSRGVKNELSSRCFDSHSARPIFFCTKVLFNYYAKYQSCTIFFSKQCCWNLPNVKAVTKSESISK